MELPILNDTKKFEFNPNKIAYDKVIMGYVEMDIPHLIQFIERGAMWTDKSELVSDLYDTFQPLFNRLVRKIKRLPPLEPVNYDPPYVFTNIFTIHRLQECASQVAWILCNVERLCEQSEDISRMSLEERIEKLIDILITHPSLSQYKYRVSRIAMGVLIARIGISEFCGCV